MTQKQNAPASRKTNESAFQPIKPIADSTSATPAKPIRFTARELRALQRLQQYPEVNRLDLDAYLAANNSPDVIQKLRHKLGEDAILTVRFPVVNAFGEKAQAGKYILTEAGHASIARMGGLPCSNA
ncbi:MAG: helix-turn-helix domain-containing protein [Comamonas sp.]|nr:helix-turn-helix domain-containing protein [Comamonas sp.]